MTDASPEAGSDQSRISIPVGGYRLEVGPKPGMAISGTEQAPAAAAAEGRKLARAAAKSDKDPARDRDAVGEVELGTDRADEVTTQVERAEHLWDGIAAGRLSITAVNDEVDTLLTLLQRLDRDGRFDEQLRLARALSKLLAVAMRWLDLFRSLRALLAAAERHGHEEARAWALHQLGTLHLAAGHLVPADHDLTQATELRRRLGDERGRAATERNLQVLCRTLRQMMRARRLVQRRGLRRLIPTSNAILAAMIVVALGAATAGAAGTGLLGGGSHGPTTNGGPSGAGALTVSGISPHTGAPTGGTLVIISGTGLSKASAVMFGNHRVTAVRLVNDPQLVVKAPAGSGTVDVTVVTPSGTSARTSADRFTYTSRAQTPVVTGLKPASGPSSGGTPVTISGTNLDGATSVDFGTTPGTDLKRISDTKVRATSPRGSGTVDVTVVSAGGRSNSTAADRFTYLVSPPPLPAITHVSPGGGPPGGGETVLITGTALADPTAVHFGAVAVAAADVVAINGTSLDVRAPAGSGIVDITVTTAGGTSAIAPTDKFAYVAAPSIDSVSPPRGSLEGGEQVTITGTHLTDVTAVDFGGAVAGVPTHISDTELQVASPAKAMGDPCAVFVKVTNMVGEPATSHKPFVYSGCSTSSSSSTPTSSTGSSSSSTPSTSTTTTTTTTPPLN